MLISLDSTRFSSSSVAITMGPVSLIGAGPPEWTESIGGDIMYFNSPEGFGKVVGKIKSDISLPILPEMLDTVKQAMGIGYGERSFPIIVQLFEPGNPAGAYFVSNDTVWFAEDAFKAPAEGAQHALKLVGQRVTNWNGITALDIAARGQDPSGISIGALFGIAVSL